MPTDAAPLQTAAPAGSRGWWLRPRVLLAWLGLTTLLGLLLFSYRYLDLLTRGESEPFLIRFIEEMTGAFSVGLLLPLVVWATRRIRDAGAPLLIGVLGHLVAFAGFAAGGTTLMWLSRLALFPLAGLGRYDYGTMSYRYLMEAGVQAVLYASIVAFVVILDRYRDARARELRLARVESELREARLRVLEAQLRPHFLFNALNTVSAVMYEDVARADRILARIGDLLRGSLEDGEEPTVPLREELATLELYLDVLRARFEEGVDVRVDADPEAAETPVPRFLLQPLVENALEHGEPPDGGPARVRVRAVRREGGLEIAVLDRGPGFPQPVEAAFQRGIGLSNVRRRLLHLYGDAAGVHVANRPSGGAEVRVWMPGAPAGEQPAAGEAGPEPAGAPRHGSEAPT